MADSWTAAFEEAAASSDKADVLLETLEIHHPLIVDGSGVSAIRAVNDTVPHDFTLELEALLRGGQTVRFEAIPFEFTFPDFEEGKAPEAEVRVDNVRRELGPYLDGIEASRNPITVIYRCYLLSDKTKVAMGPFTFVMRQLAEEGASVSGSVTFANPQNLKFPRKVYTEEDFPALTQAS
jgi:hypothetical protein